MIVFMTSLVCGQGLTLRSTTMQDAMMPEARDLVERNIGVIKSAVKRMSDRRTYDDMLGVVLLKCCEVAGRFKPDDRETVELQAAKYFATVATNAALDFIDAESAHQKRHGYNDDISDESDDAVTVNGYCLADIESLDLDDEEQETLTDWLSGTSTREAGRERGLSSTEVSRRRQELRRRIRRGLDVEVHAS